MGTTATNLQSLLQDALGKYKQHGFTATEESDEFVIRHHGEVVCRINSGAASITEIHNQCEVHLIMNHGVTY